MITDNPAITVNSISKTYKLYDSKRRRILELIHPFRKKYHKNFNALSDISFKVDKGEVVGIIGQNGSGKSTLLKILASVVYPTSGSFQCNGKVKALLELGGGLNKELTGIENIYFLGALQGYSKAEMKKRIDKILEFADIGEYAYQRVNTYSSGMYIRLAFSMTINIESDILITDEALAVGDIRFQQKCYRRIRELKDSGKTILICTHGLSTVRDFCNRAIWINKGKIVEQGDPVFVTNSYSNFMSSQKVSSLVSINRNLANILNIYPGIIEKTKIPNALWNDFNKCESFGNFEATILVSAFIDIKTNQTVSFCNGGEYLKIYMVVEFKGHIEKPDIHIVLNGALGSPVIKMSNSLYGKPLNSIVEKSVLLDISFKLPALGNGKYSVSLGIDSVKDKARSVLHWVHDAFVFEVTNPDLKYKSGAQLVIEDADFKILS